MIESRDATKEEPKKDSEESPPPAPNKEFINLLDIDVGGSEPNKEAAPDFGDFVAAPPASAAAVGVPQCIPSPDKQSR